MIKISTPTSKVNIDASLVGRLVAAQFPQWAGLPVRPVECGGWDNRTFHLGESMTARLPSAAIYAPQVEKEHLWLPKLAPLLPVSIPVPLAMGAPANDYPWPWSIYRWIDGDTATIERIVDLRQFATDLAQFLTALQRIDATAGPPAGPHSFFRGGPLTAYDGDTRQAISALQDTIDTGAVTAAWESALGATWRGSPVWFHGDVANDNLLAKNGRFSAVIDFGCSGVGDPACDLSIAWTFFEGESREAFRTALPVDNASWMRGRGWTLWKALVTLADCTDTNHAKARQSLRVIDEVLADKTRTGR